MERQKVERDGTLPTYTAATRAPPSMSPTDNCTVAEGVTLQSAAKKAGDGH